MTDTTLYKEIVVDSALSREDALKQNPVFLCPDRQLAELSLFEVLYYSFDGRIHRGQMVAHMDLVGEITGAFELLLKEKFPIQSVIPIADPAFAWDDTLSTRANNSSAFNYRNVRNTTELSNHALGRAVDINPRLNPYFPGSQVFPADATYDLSAPGTILASSKLVAYFKNLGWTWGAEWPDDPDYQHFEKI